MPDPYAVKLANVTQTRPEPTMEEDDLEALCLELDIDRGDAGWQYRMSKQCLFCVHDDDQCWLRSKAERDVRVRREITVSCPMRRYSDESY